MCLLSDLDDLCTRTFLAMKLKEYFYQAQQLQLSDTEKLFLLEKISKNKTSPQISKKFRFATQYIYASMAALIFVVIL